MLGLTVVIKSAPDRICISFSTSLALEILVSTPSIKALIRDNNIHQIDNYILSGSKDGMIRMDDSILELYKNNLISKENAVNFAFNPSELEKRLNAPSI